MTNLRELESSNTAEWKHRNVRDELLGKLADELSAKGNQTQQSWYLAAAMAVLDCVSERRDLLDLLADLDLLKPPHADECGCDQCETYLQMAARRRELLGETNETES